MSSPRLVFKRLLFLAGFNTVAPLDYLAENDDFPFEAQPRDPSDRGGASAIRRHAKLAAIAAEGKVDVAFFGDSIVSRWDQSIWDEKLAPLRLANFGVTGDKLENLLWRLRNGELDIMHPSVIVLMIGTNNLWQPAGPAAIARGIAAILSEIRERQPHSKILLLGIPPVARPSKDPIRTKIRRINEILARFPEEGRADGFVDWGPATLRRNGMPSKSLWYDGMHLTRRGCSVLWHSVEPALKALLPLPESPCLPESFLEPSSRPQP
jgi:beta-glucosidase